MMLSILIPSLICRRDMRGQLLADMDRQVQASGCAEVMLSEDNGSTPSGTKRGELARRSQGEYLTFFDDDDRVAPDYVSSLVEAIKAHRPDLVTFNLERTDNIGQRHIWKFTNQIADYRRNGDGTIMMAANHLCAWRRELALAVPWSPVWYMDDVLWYRPLVASGLVKSEHHVDRVLYHYQFDWRVTANQSKDRRKLTATFAAGGLDCYWMGDEIVVGARGRKYLGDNGHIPVRRRDGTVIEVERERLKLYHTVEVRA